VQADGLVQLGHVAEDLVHALSTNAALVDQAGNRASSASA